MPNIESKEERSKLELYRLLDEGHADVKAGKTRPLEEVMKELKQDIIDGKFNGDVKHGL